MQRIFRISPSEWAKYKNALMELEQCYEQNVREDTAEDKRELMFRDHSVALLAETNDGIVGECYGMPVEILDTDDVDGIRAYSRFGKGNSFYCHATAVLPQYEGQHIATHMTRALIAHAKKRGYRFYTLHAREGTMHHIAEKFGGRTISSHDNWYNTGYTSYFCEIDMDRMKMVLPEHQETPFFCGPASLKAAIKFLRNRDVPQEELAKHAETTAERGTTVDGIIRAAQTEGCGTKYRSNTKFADVESALKDGKSALVYWFSNRKAHWSVVDSAGDGQICIMDPADANYKIYTYDEFEKDWFGILMSYPRHEKLVVRNAIFLS